LCLIAVTPAATISGTARLTAIINGITATAAWTCRTCVIKGLAPRHNCCECQHKYQYT
jgi:hypothetical protein